jgi:hypothetical protein
VNCVDLVTVSFPDSLTTIGREAFYGCLTLSPIVLPASVSTIGERAFQLCNSITTISFPEGITTIARYLVYGCHSLESIVLPSTVTIIEESTFYACESLTTINIPDSVCHIGFSAFMLCELLAYIAIPDNTTIDPRTFVGCTELERIATEAGLSIEELGRSNWRKARALKMRFTMVSCIKRLSLLDDEELDNHLTTIQKPHIVRDCVRFLIEVGEPGLMREIVKYAV